MPTTTTVDPWLPYIRHSDAPPRGRLFCFPYAGAGASIYRAWADGLPRGMQLCAVQLTGRESRFIEPPCTSVEALVDQLIPALTPYLDAPFACFGHSMGAIVGFELARALRRRGLPQPIALFPSGRRGPRMPDVDAPLHALPDVEFIEAVKELSPSPSAEQMDAELMELVLPTLRADFALCERYEYSPDGPLTCPIHALGGATDPNVEHDALDAWRRETTAAFSMRLFEGGHLFIHSAEAALLAHLGPRLDELF